MNEHSPAATGAAGPVRLAGRPQAPWLVVFLVLLSAAFSWLTISRFGVQVFVLALGGLLGLIVLARASQKDLTIAMLVWMLFMGGLRLLAVVRMPGLPDFSLDRVFLIWIVLMFLVRAIREGQRLPGPFTADILILLHTLYILVQLHVANSIHFHVWVISNLSPLFGYLYGKYIVTKEKHVRNLLLFFLVMTIYYFIEAIAEQYHWNAIIWPKLILDPSVGFFAPGRSRGPLLHPPLFGQVMGMFLLVYFFFLTQHGVRAGLRVFLAACLGLSFLGLLYCYTRGPWVAAAVSLVVLGLLRPGYRKVLAVLAIAGMFAGVFGVQRLANTPFLTKRIHTAGTIENRVAFLATAARMIRDHPLFGVGFFRYNDYSDQYNQTAVVPIYGLVRKFYGQRMPIHDIYLGRLAEEGLVSVVLMFGFYFVIFRALARQWRGDPRGPWFNRDVLAVFAGMMVSYLVGGMIIDYRYFDLINVVFCLLGGILCGYRSEFYAGRPSASWARPGVPEGPGSG